MLKEILMDENKYINGKRVNSQSIVTTYSKSDDILQLSIDIQTLGRLEGNIEQIKSRITDEKDVNVKLALNNELVRVTGDRDIMNEKIKLQQGYIDSYNETENNSGGE